jgi:hypothetical protein
VLREWRDGSVMMQYRMDLIDATGAVIGEYPARWERLADGYVRQELLNTGAFATTVTSGLCFDRAALARVMPMPEESFRLAADGFLVRAAGLLGPVQALESPLASYRRHGSNDSGMAADLADPARFFRKKIGYLQNEHEVLRSLAERLGFRPAPNLGHDNLEFLGCRLFSLALDREQHPIAGDRVVSLLKRYLACRVGHRGPLLQMVADTAAALGVTLLPRDARASIVRLRQVPSSRPPWLRRAAESLRQSQAFKALGTNL